ncbi:N-acetylglucosaminyldiphosphoundecaprenol N-acetyl-beta-D-mannosaminyltransferase [Actinoplanes octamycinicus]|uniref:N-acetylglucosaminyldiphosphoundecaprenol N-acetyl-beta-D-mannosaminyltransferase n=1 Tax=Actinoplanes octamycinicus TaxID=135948 RepID=A0A7W7GVC3_9ACTN|nr:WecB/TagA/CpsF family glycosyltransferase [Actinoplanes octamycinicus]MBB4738953.1 N-acetylglucosaminyldiphosphoundecaprenol N-acetyl-beta-D-mannosaminyltransferase [Actinoplanes octamycinicus]GIE60081.1 UDP-N-acetyl-D-mannosaminuronic acid transferase [Actinoplanes octamycinicus]
MVIEAFDRVQLDGTGIDRITEDEVVAVVRDALSRGRGGRIITPNVDILRRASTDPEARRHLNDADLIVADGMPLIWASRLGGAPLPERVAGSSLIWTLSEGLGRDERSVFVIGGTPAPRAWNAEPERAVLNGPTVEVPIVGRRRGTAGTAVAGAVTVREVRASGAVRAAVRLAAASPGLRIAGAVSPPFGFERDEASYAEVCEQVADARPDLVFVGLGFPKQELVIERLRGLLPATWFVGCGAAVNFVAGDVHRAPRWMQRTGLEWAHRLGTEPRRLAGRYLRHDAPYALRLLARAPRRRTRRG